MPHSREIVVGTGFYSTRADHAKQERFFRIWLKNTEAVNPKRIVIVDNSELGLNRPECVRVHHNLGHVNNGLLAIRSQLNGWSMSWVISALIAYSEDCDFVYKEQDCLAFGDWLPLIKTGRAAFGNHHQLDCEQSLFWIERDFIPDFVGMYLAIPEIDAQCIPERKFRLIEERCGEVKRFAMGVGRSRPLPKFDGQPWYAQKIHEILELPAVLKHYGLTDQP